MSLHPLAERFAAVAEEYERGRPEYPAAVITVLMRELGLAKGAPVLDLAAGTGKLSRALLAAGLDIVAVEPQQELRERLCASIGRERVHAGVAEEIPLAGGAVDAVTVADAFHWFDHERALAEIARVLRPRGGLAVMTTIVDWSGASWAHELGELVAQLRPQHPQFDGPSWRTALPAAGVWEELKELQLSAPAPADAERVVAHVASMSWVAAMPEAERSATMQQVRTLVEGGSTPPRLTVHYALALTRLAG